jgi:small subunit ribosomal protein S8
VDIPGSKLKTDLARVMLQQGYITDYKFVEDGKQGILRIYLKYDEDKQHVIYGIERVSKPGRRIYLKSKDIQPVLNGMGIAVISTSKGIVTDKDARRENVGGEILCKIW